MIRKFYFFTISVLVLNIALAQDPTFFNARQSLVYLNPSFAGSNGGIRNQFSYRNQWPNLSGTYVTFLNTFDAYINSIKGGIYFSALHDDQAHGTLKTDVFSLGYAQYISLMEGNLKIIPSLQASAGVKQLDRTKLNFGDVIDARRGFVWNVPSTPLVSKKTYLDLSSGLLINYKSFYFGSSIFHINQPDEGLLGASKLPYRLSLYSSYNFKINEKTLLHFFTRYERQQKFDCLYLNVNALLFKHIIIGGGYTSNNTVDFNLGYRHDFFVLSLGYDITTSKLSENTAGSWVLQGSFNLRKKEQRKVITDFEKW
ncbi:MAG: PorP/SprF family type IX secretion system membrane protein [Bacteroidetes bacterium]|nr:PorP/SprF family type IX secretion system membrane protein [Bacteroidota bacterium]